MIKNIVQVSHLVAIVDSDNAFFSLGEGKKWKDQEEKFQHPGKIIAIGIREKGQRKDYRVIKP
jgi:hypothetical protein